MLSARFFFSSCFFEVAFVFSTSAPLNFLQVKNETERTTTYTSPAAQVVEESAFSEDGYQQVADLHDDSSMANYIRRFVDAQGKTITSEGDLEGFAPWFSGTRAKQTLKQMVAELQTKAWVVEREPLRAQLDKTPLSLATVSRANATGLLEVHATATSHANRTAAPEATELISDLLVDLLVDKYSEKPKSGLGENTVRVSSDHITNDRFNNNISTKAGKEPQADDQNEPPKFNSPSEKLDHSTAETTQAAATAGTAQQWLQVSKTADDESGPPIPPRKSGKAARDTAEVASTAAGDAGHLTQLATTRDDRNGHWINSPSMKLGEALEATGQAAIADDPNGKLDKTAKYTAHGASTIRWPAGQVAQVAKTADDRNEHMKMSSASVKLDKAAKDSAQAAIRAGTSPLAKSDTAAKNTAQPASKADGTAGQPAQVARIADDRNGNSKINSPSVKLDEAAKDAPQDTSTFGRTAGQLSHDTKIANDDQNGHSKIESSSVKLYKGAAAGGTTGQLARAVKPAIDPKDFSKITTPPVNSDRASTYAVHVSRSASGAAAEDKKGPMKIMSAASTGAIAFQEAVAEGFSPKVATAVAVSAAQAAELSDRRPPITSEKLSSSIQRDLQRILTRMPETNGTAFPHTNSAALPSRWSDRVWMHDNTTDLTSAEKNPMNMNENKFTSTMHRPGIPNRTEHTKNGLDENNLRGSFGHITISNLNKQDLVEASKDPHVLESTWHAVNMDKAADDRNRASKINGPSEKTHNVVMDSARSASSAGEAAGQLAQAAKAADDRNGQATSMATGITGQPMHSADAAVDRTRPLKINTSPKKPAKTMTDTAQAAGTPDGMAKQPAPEAKTTDDWNEPSNIKFSSAKSDKAVADAVQVVRSNGGTPAWLAQAVKVAQDINGPRKIMTVARRRKRTVYAKGGTAEKDSRVAKSHELNDHRLSERVQHPDTTVRSEDKLAAPFPTGVSQGGRRESMSSKAAVEEHGEQHALEMVEDETIFARQSSRISKRSHHAKKLIGDQVLRLFESDAHVVHNPLKKNRSLEPNNNPDVHESAQHLENLSRSEDESAALYAKKWIGGTFLRRSHEKVKAGKIKKPGILKHVQNLLQKNATLKEHVAPIQTLKPGMKSSADRRLRPQRVWMNQSQLFEVYGESTARNMIKHDFISTRPNPDSPNQTQYTKEWISEKKLHILFNDQKIANLQKEGALEVRQNPDKPERTQYLVKLPSSEKTPSTKPPTQHNELEKIQSYQTQSVAQEIATHKTIPNLPRKAVEKECEGELQRLWMSEKQLFERYGVSAAVNMIKQGFIASRQNPRSPKHIQYAMEWVDESALHALFDDRNLATWKKSGALESRQNPDDPGRTQYVVKLPSPQKASFKEVPLQHTELKKDPSKQTLSEKQEIITGKARKSVERNNENIRLSTRRNSGVLGRMQHMKQWMNHTKDWMGQKVHQLEHGLAEQIDINGSQQFHVHHGKLPLILGRAALQQPATSRVTSALGQQFLDVSNMAPANGSIGTAARYKKHV